jgi:hypothetical protein
MKQQCTSVASRFSPFARRASFGELAVVYQKQIPPFATQLHAGGETAHDAFCWFLPNRTALSSPPRHEMLQAEKI